MRTAFFRIGAVLAVLATTIVVGASPAAAATITVTTTADVVNGGDGVTSLREAIAEASASGVADEINLTNATYQLTDCVEGDIEYSGDEDLTINGADATIEQTCTDERILDKTGANSAVLTINDVTMHGGPNSGVNIDGVAIRGTSQIVLDGVTLSGFDAGSTGDVVRVDFGPASFNLEVIDSVIDSNNGSALANLNPAGIRIANSMVTNHSGSGVVLVDGNPIVIEDSTIAHNGGFGLVTSGQGFGAQPSITVTDSTFEANARGGVRCTVSCRSLTVTDSHILDNGLGAAASEGGGIWVTFFGTGFAEQVASATITDSTFAGNRATRNGGGLYIQAGGTLEGPTPLTSISGSTFTDNKALCAECDGGAIAVQAGDLQLNTTEVSDNEATRDGGGVAVDQVATDLFDDPTHAVLQLGDVTDNVAGGDGGGIYAHANLVTISDMYISGNSAGFDGGGVVVGGVAPLENGTSAVTNSTISDNSAGSFGGGLWVGFPDGSAAFLDNATVSGNTADVAGGGLAAAVTEQLDLQHVTVVENTAPQAANIGHSGTVTLEASVVATPLGGGANCDALPTVAMAPLVVSNGFNWASDTSCANGIDDSVDAGADPLLGPLADNSGWAPTHLPEPSSPLVSLIPSGSCIFNEDQRYEVRPLGAGCEPGAIEVEGTTPPPIIGTNKKDDLVGTEGPDEMFGLAGRDIMDGAGGADVIDGGKGRDTLLGGEGPDHLIGGKGRDYLDGGPGDDLLEGGPGKDILIADSPGDVLIGGPGKDKCYFFGEVDPVDC